MMSQKFSTTDKQGWEDTPNKDRQVYAAVNKVPVEVCFSGCPFFEKFEFGLNQHGQPGVCHSCQGLDNRGRRGIPFCI